MVAHLDWTLAYARLGWRMLPVHWLEDGRCCCGESDCRSPGKVQ
jgi:hypothetical protein